MASARLYAGAEAGAIQWGLAFDAGTSASMALGRSVVCDLMAICGNIEPPGARTKLVRNAFDIDAGDSTVRHLYCRRARRSSSKLTAAVHGGRRGHRLRAACPAATPMASVLERRPWIPVTGEPYPIKIVLRPESCNALAGHERAARRARTKHIEHSIPFMRVRRPRASRLHADGHRRPRACPWPCPSSATPPARGGRRLRAMKKVTTYYEAKSDEEIALALGKVLNPELFVRWDTVRGLHQRLPADRPGRGGPRHRQGAEGELLRRHRRQELGPHLGVRRRWPVHHHEAPLHPRPAGEGRLRACLRRVERHVQQA